MEAIKDEPRPYGWKDYLKEVVFIFMIIIALILAAACIYLYLLFIWYLENLSKSVKM